MIELTIAIPTYNGARLLPVSLESVLSQVSHELQDRIEILVVDNGSTDQTPETVQAYVSRYPNLIRVHRNPQNVGFDRNIDLLFKHARGRFVKILADDDALKPGALMKHLELLALQPAARVFVVNFDILSEDFSTVLHAMTVHGGQDLFCPTGNEFFLHAAGRYGQVSTLMVDRELWNNTDPQEGFGTQYIHVYMLLKMLVRESAYIVAEPWLNVRTGSPNFEKRPADNILVPMGMVRILKMCQNIGYQPRVIRVLLDEQRRYVLRRIFRSKLMGLNRFSEVVRECVRLNYDYLPLWYLYLPLLLTPRALLVQLAKGISRPA